MYKFNEEKMFYDEADNLGVIINFTNGIYYSLNKIGTTIFNNLRNGASVANIVQEIKTLSDCPKDIDNKIQDFIKYLTEKEVLVEDNNQKDTDAIIDEKCLDDGFEPKAEEFSEVQDLILADPVVEITEDMGWPTEENKNN